MDYSPPGSSWDSPDKNTGMGCRALLQGIFSAQGSNLHLLCLLHWQDFVFCFVLFCFFYHLGPPGAVAQVKAPLNSVEFAAKFGLLSPKIALCKLFLFFCEYKFIKKEIGNH